MNVDSLGFHWEYWHFKLLIWGQAAHTHVDRWDDSMLFWGWDIQSSFSASVSFTGKARWQCPRALCTDCRHAISLWSPERISKMNWSLYGLWWFGNTASGLDRIEELLQQKVWVYVYAIFRVEMRKDVRFWNILKHHATVPELFSSWPFWIARRCTKVANQTSMRTLGGSAEMQQVAESLYGVILSVLVTYWILTSLACLIRNFHKSPRTHRSSALSNRPYDGAPRCRFWCHWFLYRSLGDGSHTKTGFLSTWNTWTRCWLFFLVLHPWCQFRLSHDVTSPFSMVLFGLCVTLWILMDLWWHNMASSQAFISTCEPRICSGRCVAGDS